MNKRLRSLGLAMTASLSTAIVEAIMGYLAGSLAIVTDAFHALLDGLTTLGLLAATYYSLKPPCERHLYGHGKFETLGGMLGGLILFIMGFYFIFLSVIRISQGGTVIPREFVPAGLAAVSYALCTDIFRIKTLHPHFRESATVKATMIHAIADLGSTLLALVGFIFTVYVFPYWDAIVAGGLSILIIGLSGNLIWKCAEELTDTVSKEEATYIKEVILSVRGVRKCESLRVRRVGRQRFVEATIYVSADLTLRAAHEIATQVEERIHQKFEDAVITIHVEPIHKPWDNS